MIVAYRDHIGIVTEKVDEYGITSDGTCFYFNDKKINLEDIIEIQLEETET